MMLSTFKLDTLSRLVSKLKESLQVSRCIYIVVPHEKHSC